MPLLKTKQFINKIKPGEVLEVWGLIRDRKMIFQDGRKGWTMSFSRQKMKAVFLDFLSENKFDEFNSKGVREM